MANRTHSLLVIDLEATCWQGDPPPGMQSEVIEVGIAELDTRALEITRAEAIFVRPQHSEVSPFCTRLTSIAPEHVADAPTFPEVAERLREEYRSLERPWASWGDYDRLMFERMTELHDCPHAVSGRHLNAKTLYALTRGQVREIGLARAVANLNLPFEGRPHRGVDDARAIATVLQTLLRSARTAWKK